MLEQAFKKMSTNDYVTQIQGIDESLSVVDKIFSEITRILSEAEDSLFIAERVSYIFESLRKKLEGIFNETESLDLKVNIAVIYLTNDNFSKVDFLLNYIGKTEDVGNATFCLMKLASKGIKETELMIKHWVQKIESDTFLDEMKRKDYLQMLKDAQTRLNM